MGIFGDIGSELQKLGGLGLSAAQTVGGLGLDAAKGALGPQGLGLAPGPAQQPGMFGSPAEYKPTDFSDLNIIGQLSRRFQNVAAVGAGAPGPLPSRMESAERAAGNAKRTEAFQHGIEMLGQFDGIRDKATPADYDRIDGLLKKRFSDLAGGPPGDADTMYDTFMSGRTGITQTLLKMAREDPGAQQIIASGGTVGDLSKYFGAPGKQQEALDNTDAEKIAPIGTKIEQGLASKDPRFIDALEKKRKDAGGYITLAGLRELQHEGLWPPELELTDSEWIIARRNEDDLIAHGLSMTPEILEGRKAGRTAQAKRAEAAQAHAYNMELWGQKGVAAEALQGLKNTGRLDAEGLHNIGAAIVQGLRNEGLIGAQTERSRGAAVVQGLRNEGDLEERGLQNLGAEIVQGLKNEGMVETQETRNAGAEIVQSLRNAGLIDAQELKNIGALDAQGLKNLGASIVQKLRNAGGLEVQDHKNFGERQNQNLKNRGALAVQESRNAGGLAQQGLRNEGGLAQQESRNAGGLAQQGLRNEGGLAQQESRNAGGLAQQESRNRGGAEVQGLRNAGGLAERDLAGSSAAEVQTLRNQGLAERQRLANEGAAARGQGPGKGPQGAGPGGVAPPGGMPAWSSKVRTDRMKYRQMEDRFDMLSHTPYSGSGSYQVVNGWINMLDNTAARSDEVAVVRTEAASLADRVRAKIQGIRKGAVIGPELFDEIQGLLRESGRRLNNLHSEYVRDAVKAGTYLYGPNAVDQLVRDWEKQVNSDQPAPAPAQGAPQQGAGGVRKQYSPSLNKTRLTYPDGRVEVLDGRQ